MLLPADFPGQHGYTSECSQKVVEYTIAMRKSPPRGLSVMTAERPIYLIQIGTPIYGNDCYCLWLQYSSQINIVIALTTLWTHPLDPRGDAIILPLNIRT